MIDCPHLNGNICGIATQLAGRPIEITDIQCGNCTRQAEPKTANRITASAAMLALYQISPEAVSQREHILNPFLMAPVPKRKELPKWTEIGEGLGSEIHRILILLHLRPTRECHCVLIAKEMNRLGGQTQTTIESSSCEPIVTKRWCSYMADQLIGRSVVLIRPAIIYLAYALIVFASITGKLRGKIRGDVQIPPPSNKRSPECEAAATSSTPPSSSTTSSCKT